MRPPPVSASRPHNSSSFVRASQLGSGHNPQFNSSILARNAFNAETAAYPKTVLDVHGESNLAARLSADNSEIQSEGGALTPHQKLKRTQDAWRKGVDSYAVNNAQRGILRGATESIGRIVSRESGGAAVSVEEIAAARAGATKFLSNLGGDAASVEDYLSRGIGIYKRMQGENPDAAVDSIAFGKELFNDEWVKGLENDQDLLKRVQAQYNGVDRLVVEEIDNKVYVKGYDEEGHHHGGIIIDLDEAVHSVYILIKSVSQAGTSGNGGILATFDADTKALQSDAWGHLGEGALPGGAGDMAFSATISGAIMPALALLAIKEGYSSFKHSIEMRGILKKYTASAEAAIRDLDGSRQSQALDGDTQEHMRQQLLSLKSNLGSLQLANEINILDGGMGAGSFASGVAILTSSLLPFLTKAGIAGDHGINGLNIGNTAATAASSVGAVTTFAATPLAGIFATILGGFFGKKTALMQSRVKHLGDALLRERPNIIKELQQKGSDHERVSEAMKILEEKFGYRERQIGKSNSTVDQFTSGAVGYTLVGLANVIIKGAALGGAGALATTPGGIVLLILMLGYSGLMLKGSKTFLTMHGKMMEYGQNQNPFTDLPEVKRNLLSGIDIALGAAEGEKLRSEVLLGAKERYEADQDFISNLVEGEKNFEKTQHLGDVVNKTDSGENEYFKPDGQLKVLRDAFASGGRHFPAAVKSRAAYMATLLKTRSRSKAHDRKKEVFAAATPDITKTRLAAILGDTDKRKQVLDFMENNAQSLLKNNADLQSALERKTQAIRDKVTTSDSSDDEGYVRFDDSSDQDDTDAGNAASDALNQVVDRFTTNQIKELEGLKTTEAELNAFIGKVEQAKRELETGSINSVEFSDKMDGLMRELTFLRRGATYEAEAEKFTAQKIQFEQEHPNKTFNEYGPDDTTGKDYLADDLLEDGGERYQKVRGIMMEVFGEASWLRKMNDMNLEIEKVEGELRDINNRIKELDDDGSDEIEKTKLLAQRDVLQDELKNLKEEWENKVDNKKVDAIGHDARDVPGFFKRNKMLLPLVLLGALGIPLSIVIPSLIEKDNNQENEEELENVDNENVDNIEQEGGNQQSADDQNMPQMPAELKVLDGLLKQSEKEDILLKSTASILPSSSETGNESIWS